VKRLSGREQLQAIGLMLGLLFAFPAIVAMVVLDRMSAGMFLMRFIERMEQITGLKVDWTKTDPTRGRFNIGVFLAISLALWYVVLWLAMRVL